MLIRRTTSFVGLIAGEVAALVLLTRLGSYGPGPANWRQVGTWLADTPPEDALVTAVRLLALGIAWWLTASTLLYALAGAAQIPTVIRGVRWVTLPPLRRMIDGVLATTVVASSTFGGGRVAIAQPVRVGPVVVQLDQQSDPLPAVNKPAYRPRPAGDGSTKPQTVEPSATTTAPSSTSTTTTKPPEEPLTTSLLTPPRREAERAPVSRVYVVQPGDNLWKIAQRHLAATTGRPFSSVSAVEVQRYWSELVEMNRHALRSANPHLIYPGESITLSPLARNGREPHGAPASKPS